MFSTLMRCYFIGLSFTWGVGPIFLLTFRAGMIMGFMYGCAIACGSACAESILFLLGTKGLLSLLKESKYLVALFDVIGGTLLIGFGIYTFYRTRVPSLHVRRGGANSWLLLFTKSFVITLLNPFSVALF